MLRSQPVTQKNRGERRWIEELRGKIRVDGKATVAVWIPQGQFTGAEGTRHECQHREVVITQVPRNDITEVKEHPAVEQETFSHEDCVWPPLPAGAHHY